MAILTLRKLFAVSNLVCLDLLREAEHHALWKSIAISKEGREPELRQLRALYDKLQDVHERSMFSDPDCLQRTAVLAAADVFVRTEAPSASDTLTQMVGDVAIELLSEEVFFGFPSINWDVPLSLEDGVALRNYLERKRHFLLYAPDIIEQWSDRFVDMWVALFKHLPDRFFKADHGEPGSFDLSTPVADILDAPALAIEDLLLAIAQPREEKHGLFEPLVATVYDNLFVATGIRYEDRATSKKPLLFPSKSREPVQHLPGIYLTETPFLKIFSAPVAINVPEETRFEHMHIVAGTGHGKTQLLQHLIALDLQRPADQIPSMVILDSQGDMINTLKRLSVFDPEREGSLLDRLLIVDPSDVAFPPSLNLFDVHSDRLKDYSQRDREQVLAGIIEIYDYIFGGLLGAELTQKQAMVFRFLAQLMLSIPGATIHTLRDLLEDATPYMTHVATLPPTARGFFENHFFSHGYKATREQILRRLYGVLQNPSFERMFAQPENRLDLFETLNQGGIVLVNTAKDFLKSEASSIFGRYVIALTLKAAFERATLPRNARRPTFLIIDEASEYFDDNIDNLLIQARKFNLGLVMAHQYLGQLSRNLPASLMTNTSIKLAGGVSDRDAHVMASEMRTSADFLNAMTKNTGETQFALFARNHTPNAMRFTVPFGTAESMDAMSDEAFAKVLSESRARLSSLLILERDKDEQGDSVEPKATDPRTASPADDPFDEPYD